MSSERQEDVRVQRAGPDPLESLPVELNVWRKTPFDRLAGRFFRPPALVAATADRRGVDVVTVRTEDIRAMLIEVVAAVERTQGVAFTSSTEGAILSPAAVREVFGLTAESMNASTRARQRLAGQRVGRGVSPDTIRKHNHAYVDQLASWVREPTAPRSSPPVSSGELHLIPRPPELAWLHSTYRRLQASRGGFFLLWGLDGTGKTTLARQFADQVAPAGAIGFIRIGRRGLYEDDVRWVLRREGLEADTLPDEQCIALFRQTATRFRTVRLLVMDDARCENDITALLSRGSNVPVLVTTREQLRLTGLPDTDQPPARQPVPVTVEDAAAYLTQRLPTISEPAVRHLAELLGGHVETLHHAVHYLDGKPAAYAEALIEEFTRRARYALRDLADVRGAPRSLPVILEQQLRELHGDEVARALITSIIWMNSSGEQPKDLIVAVVSRLLRRPTDLELEGAVLRLERLGLLTTTDESFVVTKLTAHILRDQLVDTREDVLVAYEQVIAEPPESDDHRTLIQILRHEYRFLEELRAEVAKAIDNTHTPRPALIPLDDSNWALFKTGRFGSRLVDLYRVTSESILRLKAEGEQWEAISAEEVDLIVDLASRVYPIVMEEWSRISSA